MVVALCIKPYIVLPIDETAADIDCSTHDALFGLIETRQDGRKLGREEHR
jgi:hypothetical protein